MEKNKNKKRTLTISSSFNKKFDSGSYKKDGKKSFLIDKKKSFKSAPKSAGSKPVPSKNFGRVNKKNFARKFVEQQATKRFIHPGKKEVDKAKERSPAKPKNLESRRELKLTVSRAMNVEEFEIKQRSKIY